MSIQINGQRYIYDGRIDIIDRSWQYFFSEVDIRIIQYLK